MSVISRAEEGPALSRALFPELAARLDAALDRYGSADPGARAEREFDEALDRAVSERFSDAGFGSLVQTDGGARLAGGFVQAREALLSSGDGVRELTLPEPEAFESAGYDLRWLSERLEKDETLVSVPAPYGLGARHWQEFLATSGAASLVLASEVQREFAVLDSPPVGEGEWPLVVEGGVGWTLRLVPATPAPPILGLNFAHGGPHATLPEMLILQLMRSAAGEPLLDGGEGAASFTWLAGELSGGRLAARHVYDAAEGAIRITAREVGSQGPHLGTRSAV